MQHLRDIEFLTGILATVSEKLGLHIRSIAKESAQNLRAIGQTVSFAMASASEKLQIQSH